MNRISKLTAAAVLSAAMLCAYQGRPRGHHGTPPTPQEMVAMRVARLTTRLTLTPDQAARATTIFTDAGSAATNARTSSSDNRTALATAIKSNDTAAIDRLSTTLGALSGQLTAIEARASAAFYALLTPAQKTVYETKPEGRGKPGFPGGFR